MIEWVLRPTFFCMYKEWSHSEVSDFKLKISFMIAITVIVTVISPNLFLINNTLLQSFLLNEQNTFAVYFGKYNGFAYQNYAKLIFRGLFWGGGWGGIKSTPCLKLVMIMLETSNLASKYTHIFSFRKFTFKYLGALNFTDGSILLQKVSVCWQK